MTFSSMGSSATSGSCTDGVSVVTGIKEFSGIVVAEEFLSGIETGSSGIVGGSLVRCFGSMGSVP